MKKYLFIISLCLLVFASAQAQETFKPGTGGFTAEVEFRPLNANPINLNYFRGRLFTSDNFAVRLGANLYYKNLKEEPDNGQDESKRSTILFGIYPGFEQHFGDMKRLSPYIGGELGVAIKSAKDTYTDNSGTSQAETVYNGAWSDGSERGYFSVGLNFLVGADFYFSQKIYMGVEMGFGLQSITESEVKLEETGQQDNTISEKANAMEIGVNYNPAIRLGFSF
ncbi:MAG: hypothetical protein JXA03_03325 [Bacteroidales bacterium]|nr:hypothetical protein [Bacteroidales bacterium]